MTCPSSPMNRPDSIGVMVTLPIMTLLVVSPPI
jgi:hypothetical protein